ncbi:hypothetical protein JOC86_002298 [Bacillus pakistanensis]|uniref:Uncharacterized protein n=1 Tax=Rossellomorea pakistanensis TaxID=992288 RepID=A0ABS2ND32_9BACI|nr:accessory Sec system protein Asp2 [Bacillus pakistanensis]MBM7585756.1 hypothetical protein [Bacillus pakistanensis]
MFKFDEKVFKGDLPINYVFESGNVNQDHLIVVFSGFNIPKTKAKENMKHTYNYIRTLRNIDCNKLFILDNYGPRGSYYIGNKETIGLEKSINELIEYILQENGIARENVITAGSSKGGSAALYYGLKYNYGHIVAGAPQTRIADYIKAFAEETFEYMVGKSPTEKEIESLNQLLFRQLHSGVGNDLRILTSENDIQYKKHIVPLIEQLNEHEIEFNLKIDNNIQSHGQIAEHFPSYLITNILDIIDGIKIKELKTIQVDSTKWRIGIEYENSLPSNYRQKLIVKDQNVNVSESEIKDVYEFDLRSLDFNGTAILDVMFVLERNQDGILNLPLTKQFVSNGSILKGTEFSINNNTINFSIDIEESTNLEYAFYVRRNNKVIDKIMYQKSRELKYPINEPGKYQIHYFIRPKNGEKYSDRSKVITV